MTGEITGPQRAFTITLRIGADTAHDLAMALHEMALRVERDEVTNGTFGSPTSGGEYELLTIDKTHDAYFADLKKYLEERRAAQVT
jgi:hypothetical protein